MAWINLEVIGSGDKVSDIQSVKMARDDDGEVLLFNDMFEADLWCQKNFVPGALYSQIEVWG